MKRGIHDNGEVSGDSAFEAELDRFLRTPCIPGSRDSASAITRRVRDAGVRRDRAFRMCLCGAAVALLLVAVWPGAGRGSEDIAAARERAGEDYVEVYVLEETLYGAEVLVDEEAMETLDLLLGG